VVIDSVAALVLVLSEIGRWVIPMLVSNNDEPKPSGKLLATSALKSGLHHQFSSTSCVKKIGITYGSPETTTGSNALKFYASVRLDIRQLNI